MKDRKAIPFNLPHIVGKELYYIAQAVSFGNIAADGEFTKRCSLFLESYLKSARVLMTPSCTAALEMSAMLLRLQAGDEVIMPSFTFVSTANAFYREGARPVFLDIRPDTLNIDEELLESAITPKTKGICVVHYAGVACEMDRIMEIARRRQIPVIEDAAHGLSGKYKGMPLGAIGDLGCFSFHETKNYTCGEGGALSINNNRYLARAEVLRNKGTNRAQFFRGEVDKYTWVDLGSSYVPSEICCGFLYAQLELFEQIRLRRKEIYDFYYAKLLPLAQRGALRLPHISEDCESSYHMFYLLLESAALRDSLMGHLSQHGVGAIFHYVPLHSSPVGQELGYEVQDLPVTSDISGQLLRLPFFYDITIEQQCFVVEKIGEFFDVRRRKGSSFKRKVGKVSVSALSG